MIDKIMKISTLSLSTLSLSVGLRSTLELEMKRRRFLTYIFSKRLLCDGPLISIVPFVVDDYDGGKNDNRVI